MKKPIQIIDYSCLELGFRGDDYKIEQLVHDTTQNLESVKKWLYLGADISNPNWAKIGITAGDLSTRSYSSANPNYYIFCAFQFNYNVSENLMRWVEAQLLNTLDLEFKDWYGQPLRLRHYESGKLSECYHSINFEHFLLSLHDKIYHDHGNYFVLCEYENEVGVTDGAYALCFFNTKVNEHIQKAWIQKLIQSD